MSRKQISWGIYLSIFSGLEQKLPQPIWFKPTTHQCTGSPWAHSFDTLPQRCYSWNRFCEFIFLFSVGERKRYLLRFEPNTVRTRHCTAAKLSWLSFPATTQSCLKWDLFFLINQTQDSKFVFRKIMETEVRLPLFVSLAVCYATITLERCWHCFSCKRSSGHKCKFTAWWIFMFRTKKTDTSPFKNCPHPS